MHVEEKIKIPLQCKSSFGEWRLRTIRRDIDNILTSFYMSTSSTIFNLRVYSQTTPFKLGFLEVWYMTPSYPPSHSWFVSRNQVLSQQQSISYTLKESLILLEGIYQHCDMLFKVKAYGWYLKRYPIRRDFWLALVRWNSNVKLIFPNISF